MTKATRFLSTITAWSLLCIFAMPLQAAQYRAGAVIEVTLTDIVNLDNPGDLSALVLQLAGGSEQDYMSVAGNGAADRSHTVTLNGLTDLSPSSGLTAGDVIDLGVTATGSTSASFGEAESIAAVAAVLDMFNDSATDSYALSFDIRYRLSALAEVDQESSQSASAASYIEIVDDQGGLSILDQLLVEAAFGPASPAEDFTSVTLTLLPFASNSLQLAANADGAAASVVPLPAAMWLFAAALFGLSGHAVRQGRSRSA